MGRDGVEPITLVGNLTADPGQRFTASRVAVAAFTVASTPRVFDRQSGEWKDGDTLFLRCTLWRRPAENTAETLSKGAGHRHRAATQRIYDTGDGQTRTVTEIDVEDIGPSLRYATATVTRTPKTSTSSGGVAGGDDHPPF